MSTPKQGRRRKQDWGVGSVFLVEQSDGLCCLGQVLDMMFPNVPSCAFYDMRFPHGTSPPSLLLPGRKAIAAVSTTREQLDRGVWKVVGCAPVALEREHWPNESLRDFGWVGATTYGSEIVNKFLEAYYGLVPWDCYAGPDYFKKLFLPSAEVPKHRVFKGK